MLAQLAVSGRDKPTGDNDSYHYNSDNNYEDGHHGYYHACMADQYSHFFSETMQQTPLSHKVQSHQAAELAHKEGRN